MSNYESGDPSQRIELAQDNAPVIVIEPKKKTIQSQNDDQIYTFNETTNYLRMRFCYRPERIDVGQIFYINEDKIKAVGVISKVFF